MPLRVYLEHPHSQRQLLSRSESYGKAFSLRSIPDKHNQQERLKESINTSIREFNNHIINNPSLNKTQSKLLENLIINNSGAASQSSSNKYIRFELKGSHFESQPIIPTGRGRWEISAVPQIYSYHDRATVYLQNEAIGIRIKFLFNFKNNTKVKGIPEKADAKLGLGSPSWNVWISEI